MNMMKAVVILGILLVPYALMHVNAQEEVKVEIAKGSKNGDNGKFFVPARITIPVGTTVVWTNLDDAPHTVTDGTPTSKQWGTIFDSGIMRQDKVYKFSFNEAGEFPYLCALHPWMAGKVTVLPEGVSVPVEVSVTTDKTTYQPGDNVNVKGSVSPAVTDKPVVIEVLNPNHAQFRTDKITVKDDGVFKYDFKLAGELALLGSYTVKVTYSDKSTESTFVVEKSEKKPQKIEPQSGSGAADVRVTAKQVKDFVILRVKNADGSGASVYGISIQIPGSTIEAFKGPKDWSKPESLSSEVRSSTLDEPIKPGHKEVFKLKVNAAEIVIKWIAYDANDSIIDQGDTKAISHK